MKNNYSSKNLMNFKNRFCALAVLTFAFSTASFAQNTIRYTDITDGTPASIDFNNDNNSEITISYNGTMLNYQGDGETTNIHAFGPEDWDTVNFVNRDFIIGANNNWNGFGDAALLGWGDGNATLPVNTDKYIAVRIGFAGNNNLYYGWIRVSINANEVVTYKDFAYNTTAGQTILAGQTTNLSNTQFANSTVNVYPNPFKEQINLENNTDVTQYAVWNTLGQLVKNGAVVGTAIQLQDLPTGTYILELKDDNGVNLQSKKIIKS